MLHFLLIESRVELAVLRRKLCGLSSCEIRQVFVFSCVGFKFTEESCLSFKSRVCLSLNFLILIFGEIVLCTI